MAYLNIYEYDASNATYKVISQDGLQTSPVQTSHDGTNGEVVEKKLFLRNSNTDFFYTDVTLTPSPARKTRVGDIQYPEAFIGFKVIIQENQPTKGEWLATESGNTADMANIGTTSQGDNGYKPFWIQIEVPPGTRAQTISDISINVQADENPVGA
jgi:hypothetical protein